MSKIRQYVNSSIGKKQIVAVTGLLLILFLVGHLAGNFFIYGGPQVFNGYAKKLASLRPFLYLIEFGLLGIFVIHMYVTALLVFENIEARGNRYVVYKAVGERSLATRIMPYTGILILAFVIWHLLDFTFADHDGPRGVLPDGQSAGLYGVVYTSFMNPWHSIFYILAMFAVGFHLSHGVQSFIQTFGFCDAKHTAFIKKVSDSFGQLIALGYSSIPLYILWDSMKYKSGV